MTARSEDLAETVRLIEEGGGRALAVRADVTDEQAMRRAIGEVRRRLGPVDLLVNNAGVTGPIGRLWEVDADEWWRTVEINLRGVILSSRLVLPEMVARRKGRIINLSSTAGVGRWPQVSAYAISKAAVIKFTENLAVETKREGVAVFSIHPGLPPIGLTETALGAEAPASSPEGRSSWLREQIANGKAAAPERAARLVMLLASGRADRLSGCHLSVDDDVEALLDRAVGDQRRRSVGSPAARPTAGRWGQGGLRRPGLGRQISKELAAGPVAVEGIGGKRGSSPRSSPAHQVAFVPQSLHVIAPDRGQGGLGRNAVDLGGIPPEDAVADRAFRMRTVVRRPAEDLGMGVTIG